MLAIVVVRIAAVPASAVVVALMVAEVAVVRVVGKKEYDARGRGRGASSEALSMPEAACWSETRQLAAVL